MQHHACVQDGPEVKALQNVINDSTVQNGSLHIPVSRNQQVNKARIKTKEIYEGTFKASTVWHLSLTFCNWFCLQTPATPLAVLPLWCLQPFLGPQLNTKALHKGVSPCFVTDKTLYTLCVCIHKSQAKCKSQHLRMHGMYIGAMPPFLCPYFATGNYIRQLVKQVSDDPIRKLFRQHRQAHDPAQPDLLPCMRCTKPDYVCHAAGAAVPCNILHCTRRG